MEEFKLDEDVTCLYSNVWLHGNGDFKKIVSDIVHGKITGIFDTWIIVSGYGENHNRRYTIPKKDIERIDGKLFYSRFEE